MKNSIFKFLCMFFFLAGTMFSVTSCKDDKDDPAPLTPDKSKSKLEDVGVSLTKEIDASKYQDLIQAIKDFSEISESIDIEADNSELKSTVRSLEKVVSTNDMNTFTSMLKAAKEDVPEYYTSLYATYTYDAKAEKWSKTANGNEVSFKFKSQGQDVSISMSVSADYYTVVADDETGYIPKSGTLTIKKGSTTLLVYTVNIPVFSKTNNSVNMTISVPNANLTWSAEMNLSSTDCTVSVSLKKGGKTLISGSASAKGSNKIFQTDGGSLVVDEDNVTADDLTKTLLTLNVMDQVYFTIECSDVANFVEDLNKVEEKYPVIDNFESKQNDTPLYSEYLSEYYHQENYFKEITALYNQYLTAYFSYDKDLKVKEGNLYFDYIYGLDADCVEDYYGDVIDKYCYKYDNTEQFAGIQFPDGSKYRLEEYFNGDNFSDFLSALDKLAADFGIEE